MELLDVIDENGNLTGEVMERGKIHELNLWHHHVFAWIMNNNGMILLQQRALSKKASPGKWSRTGGHVDAGESCDEAIKREVFEEIGLVVERIKRFEIFKSLDPNEHYITYGYIIFTDKRENEFKLQKDEVNSVRYYSIEELERIREQGDNNYSLNGWSDEYFNEQIHLLKEYRARL